jgi:putative endonuclease
MHFVYLIQSISRPTQRYVGYTTNVEARIAKHNEGGCPHTAEFKPWRLVTYIAFEDKPRALAFEAYLKTGSGRAFAAKHFWPPTGPSASTT